MTELAAKRRDERNMKVTPPTPSSPRKNKRDFCRGKKGVSHQPKCMDYNVAKAPGHTWSVDWKLLVCTVCGKELEFYLPNTWGKAKPVPAWVEP